MSFPPYRARIPRLDDPVGGTFLKSGHSFTFMTKIVQTVKSNNALGISRPEGKHFPARSSNARELRMLHIIQ